jgi:UDP-glucose 4-epimerase
VGAGGGTFNVGSGVETSVNALFDACRTVAGSSAEPEYSPARPGDLLRSVLDPRGAKAALGWEARVPLGEGLRTTYDWATARR